MRDIVPDIRSRGGELYGIGNGSIEQAAAFARERALDFDLFVDPGLSAYQAAGLRRDLGATLSPRVVGNAFRSLLGGFRQGRTEGDAWQQGGSFVIAPGGRIVLAHRSRVAGEHVAPAEILRALDALSADTAR